MRKLIIILICIMINISPTYAYEFGDLDSNSDQEDIKGIVYMEGEFLDKDILKLSIFSKEVSVPVLGIAFHLKYEGNKVQFLRYDPGSFLELGGNPFYLVQDEESSQKVIFGETLRREDDFPIGGGKVSDLYFQIIDDEEFNFEFENNVISTLDEVRQDIDNISWENLYLNKNGTSISQKIESEENWVASQKENSFWEKYAELIIVLSSSLILSLFMIFLIKRESNKKHLTKD